MYDLSVIIVNYNVKELLENCINSILAASTKIKTEIIVVDNNSFDGSAEYLQNKFSHLQNFKIISNKINLGFSKANNQGVKIASGKYVLILNPDTLLKEDTLEKTIGFYEKQNNAGAVTCKLILPNGKLDLACRRSFPTPSVAVFRILGLSKVFPKSRTFGKYNLTYLNENSTYEVDAIVGAFMLIKKEIYDSVKGFDEEYFMYGEDLDLCYRLKKAGYKNYYFHETSIIHYKGESTKKSSISYVNNFYGAMQIFARKNLHSNSLVLNSLIRLMILYRAVISYISRIIKFIFPVLIDLALIISAMIVAIFFRFEFLPFGAYLPVIIIYSIVWTICLTLSGSYKPSMLLSIVRPLTGILFGFFINSSLTYFFNEYAFSRAVVIRTTAYAFLGLAVWRIILRIIRLSTEKNILYKVSNTLIIGRNEETESFVQKLRTRVESEFNILGYVSTNGNNTKEYIGNLDNLKDLIKTNGVKTLIFAKSVLSNEQIFDLMWNLNDQKINYRILSGDKELLVGKSSLDKIDEMYLMNIEYNISKKTNIFVKRFFDITISFLSLLTIFPIAWLLTRSKNFNSQKSKFRKKLLLLPNVFKGTLSFVGRSTWDETSEGLEYLGKKGLTGLVQINFYKNLTKEETEFYNYYYAKNQSLALDVEIILKTISLMIFKKKIVSA